MTQLDDTPTLRDYQHAGQTRRRPDDRRATRLADARERRAAEIPSISRAVADAGRADIGTLRAALALMRLGMWQRLGSGDLEELQATLTEGRAVKRSWRETVRVIANRGCVGEIAPF